MYSFFDRLIGCWVRFRQYGFGGVCTFFISKIKKVKRDRRLLALCSKPYPKPIKGITLVGTFRLSNSYSKVMRDMAYALKQIGVPFQTVDLSELPSNVPLQDLDGLLTPCEAVHLSRYSHILEMDDCPVPSDMLVKRSRICFWEFDSGLVEEFPSLINCREIVGMSDYNCSVFRKVFPSSVAVRQILYPFRSGIFTAESPSAIRNRYGLLADDFVVFFNFDFCSCVARKNPEGAIRAFARAFGEVPCAKLVFKTMNADKFPEQFKALQDLAEALGIKKRFIVITDYIPYVDLQGLTGACDVYLSLHRGEGLGLGIAEAMSLGKPVVTTGYSAPTEFCNADNSILVPYTITPVPRGVHMHPNYLFVKEWAEPDVSAAAKGLRCLYDNEDLRQKLGENGKAFIAEHFSLENFRKSVETFLDR